MNFHWTKQTNKKIRDASRNGYEADPDSETVIRNLEQLSYVIGAAVIKKPEDKGINKKQPKIRR